MVANKHPGLSLSEDDSIILIGSRALNYHRKDSDYNLVVLTDNPRPPLRLKHVGVHFINYFIPKNVSSFFNFLNAKVLLDPKGRFARFCKRLAQVFKRHLPKFLVEAKKHFDDAFKMLMSAKDKVTEQILKGELLRRFFQLYILSLAKPYPYEKWLVAVAIDAHHNSKILDFGMSLLKAKTKKQYQSWHRRAVAI